MLKKQLIMEKASELFAQQGFEATSIKQITDYCGISKGAFYLSFKSKDELILALIDHFMIQIISDIDYIVKSVTEDENLLYQFFYTTFHTFQMYSDFAKIFIKEQSQTLNEELIKKIHSYDLLLENLILYMIDRIYGDEIKHIKYDLMYCIKSFLSMYSNLLLFKNAPLELNQLSQSLAEKITILAEYTTISFLSEELIQMTRQPMHEKMTKEQIIELMEQKINEMEESIEKESLVLLKNHLLESNLSPAIVKGLLENIRNHPHCKWIAYLLRNH
ncbi:TetR/AcrR family transcriptional regulator [Niallia endozanthoxylica]|uniref:TetR/AcrR family transcriptional regulator n=1 Tax=Niallia endozanthoxylica TaxID=2036016 RepID=A0A5J5HZY6_9BACI|nr:TetR/AcrR family transcriptional regulator [Niallia endozanthoxylica]KAA9028468.1 TetR/AcrR family transcriptional regulator [Niallia endozanthoxylica]